MKENRESVMTKMLQLRNIIEDVSAKLGPGEELPSDLQEPFRHLERCAFLHICRLVPC